MDSPSPREAPSSPADFDAEDSYLKLLRSLKAGSRDGADLGVVRRIATWIDSPAVLGFVGEEPRWVADWGIKEALVRNPATPEPQRSLLGRQVSIFDLLRELDQPGLSAAEQEEIREDARSLINTLPPTEREAVRQHAYELSASRRGGERTEELTVAETLTGEITIPEPVYQELDARELELLGLWDTGEPEPLGEPVAEAEPEAATAVAEAPEEETREITLPGYEPTLDELFPAEPAESPGPPGIPWEEPESKPQAPAIPRATPPGAAISQIEIQVARTTSDVELLGKLALSNDEGLQLALVENAALPPDVAASLARRSGMRVAAAMHRNRRLFMNPIVRRALLDSPNAPPAAQMAIVDGLDEPAALLQVVGSSRVRHLEVKAKARSRLRVLFRAMTTGEKLAAVRRSGRLLLRQLWTDFFRDEVLVLRCLEEKQLDEGTVLEIARSQVAPRKALEKIGTTTAWTSQYGVVLALVENPKTPRQVAQRLIGKLTPADRQRVKRNLSVAESVRRLA